MENESLEGVRQSWEKNQTILMEIPVVIMDFLKLFVILKSQRDGKYKLNRYFRTGNAWQVSVDLETDDVNEIYREIQEDKDLKYLKDLLQTK